MKLNKDNVKNLSQRRKKEIQVGDYEISIIELTIPQQLELEKVLHKKDSNSDVLKPMLKYSVVDDEDNLILTDEIIDSLPASIAANIFQECVKLNELSDANLEDKAKNL